MSLPSLVALSPSPERRRSRLLRTLAGCSVLVVLGCAEAPRVPSWLGGGRDWPGYLGGPGVSQWSRLDRIRPENVRRLEVAWEFRAGGADTERNRSQIQCNPLVIDGVLYGVGPRLDLFALDAATGRRLWTFDPFAGEAERPFGVQRGIASWRDEEGALRLFLGAGSRLFAVDAANGERVESFGKGGVVDLGLSPEGASEASGEALYVSATSPGIVFEDLLIVGVRVSESLPAAPGDVRAFDARTGALRWTFRTIPAAGEPGAETWPPGARLRSGGANAWAGLSLDPERGVVYVPTGSAADDFYGANRVGSNLFANSVLALDARSGERLWHFQAVRHDVWDRDLPAPPNLVSVERDGRSVEAVAQITKSGHVFLLDRDTGEPLWPLEEAPVEPSDLPGEELWASQPLPTRPPPFSRQALTAENVTRRTPEAREWVLERLSRLRTGRQFLAPSREGTVIFPGFDGGGEWGGAAWDPERGWLVVNASEMPWVLTMVAVAHDAAPSQGSDRAARRQRARLLYAHQCGVCHGVDREGDPLGEFPALLGLASRTTRDEVGALLERGSGRMPSYVHIGAEQREDLVDLLFEEAGRDGKEIEPDIEPEIEGEKVEADARSESRKPGVVAAGSFVSTGYHRFVDPDGYPAVEPPWGTLTAIDLGRGDIVWQVPLGDHPEARGADDPPTGTEGYGGPLVTAGGLVFVAATKDERLRAFDLETGEELWSARLPAGGYATPATYAVDGRQFVVVAAGGGKMGTPSGDSYVAFALPEH